MIALGGLFVLNLLLRVFYLRYDFVNGDEGVRALTAVRMLEGARMYVDVVTDKPPGASLFYAAVFTIFGRSMKAVHLAATVWNFGTALIVFLIASRFYSRRVGLWAALLFVYFSTNYFTQDMMAANTELLMALPYTAAFLFFMVARDRYGDLKNVPLSNTALVLAGLLTGIATLFKQVGVLNLLFFALYEGQALWKMRDNRQGENTSVIASIWKVIARLSLVALGFVFVLVVFVLWLVSIGALHDFWRNGIVLSKAYSRSSRYDSESHGLLWIVDRILAWAGIGLCVL